MRGQVIRATNLLRETLPDSEISLDQIGGEEKHSFLRTRGSRKEALGRTRRNTPGMKVVEWYEAIFGAKREMGSKRRAGSETKGMSFKEN